MTKTQINQLITDNKDLFAQGSSIPEATICAWYGIERPRRNTVKSLGDYQMAKFRAYCQLNRYLSAKGLVIRSANYCTEFHVQEGLSIDRQVARLAKLGTDKLRNSRELENGLKSAGGKWKKLTRAQLKVVRDYENDVLKRM